MRAIAPTSDYFQSQYRDYERQNPPRKLDHYLTVIGDHWEGEHADLLDVGCGLGSFLEQARLRHPIWELNGTDIDRTGVETTLARVPEAEVVNISADQQSHPDQCFDIVTAWDVLEHVEALNDAGDSIAAMLRPGGIFVFVVPVYDGPLGPVVEYLDKDPTHLHKRGRDWWLDWAAERFDILDWHGIFRYLVPGGRYIHLSTQPLRRFSTAILVVCAPGHRR